MNHEEYSPVNKNRSAILQIISEQPGSTFSEIMKALKIKEGTLRYHLNYLQKREMVKYEERRGKKRYFSSKMEFLKEGLGEQISPFRKRILGIIEEEPGIDQRSLARSMHTNRFLLYYHLDILIDLGMIRKIRDGKYMRYFILSSAELRKRILLALIDDLLTGEIPEERYQIIKEQIEKLK